MKSHSSYFLNVQTCLIITLSLFLSACGGGSSSSSDSDNKEDTVTSECERTLEGVNWTALMTEDCRSLSQYNLFAEASDPTKNPNDFGLPYNLSVALFTDYASKYRFVFIPEGKKAEYSEHEVFNFPVGSVLVKTFALPSNTDERGANETLIETRLLIHRESGWVALPYVWNTPEDADLTIAGKTVSNVSVRHNGENLTFDYHVPQASQCTSCHSVVPLAGHTGPAIFKPIGPKARFLNKDYEYQNHTMNQLMHWSASGYLSGLPTDHALVDQSIAFSDSTDTTQLSSQDVEGAARAYLDINCAHCHRSELTLPENNYAGPAGDSGLNLEFNRNFCDDPAKFGVNKTPVAGGSGDMDNDGEVDYPYDVIPGEATRSYLWFRMSTLDSRHKMPELGRSTIHTEGVALIEAWINQLTTGQCL